MRFNLFGREKRELKYIVPNGDALVFNTVANGSASVMNLSTVYRCTELISDALAMLPIQIKDKDNGTDTRHPLNLVFDFKDSLLSKFEFIKMAVQSVLLKGNGFALIRRAQDGRPMGLEFVESGYVTVSYNKERNELHYIVRGKRVERDDMLHFVKNSYDGINGKSIISWATRTIGIADSTENSAKNFFSNGCNLSGVLTIKGPVSKQQKDDARASWNMAYGRGGNGLAILDGNMAYQPIQLNAADSQMLETRKFNTIDICRFFGVSPVLVGDLEHTPFTSLEAVQTEFITHTLSPYVTMMEEELNRKLVATDDTVRIDFKESELIKSDKQATANYYVNLLNSGVLSPNEVRHELGYERVEGLDDHHIAFNASENSKISGGKETDKSDK